LQQRNTTQNRIIRNNIATAPPAAPAIIGMGRPLSELLSVEVPISQFTIFNYNMLQSIDLPVATQLKAPPILLHFTDVPSSFTSSQTCSPLPLTLKPFEQVIEQLEP